VKRIDLLEAGKLLAKKKMPVNDVTLMLATQYAEGWRLGDVHMSFEAWLDEDIEDADVEEAADADPTVPVEETPTPNGTKWRASAPASPDSLPESSGIST
jgi:hypothetical protein